MTYATALTNALPMAASEPSRRFVTFTAGPEPGCATSMTPQKHMSAANISIREMRSFRVIWDISIVKTGAVQTMAMVSPTGRSVRATNRRGRSMEPTTPRKMSRRRLEGDREARLGDGVYTTRYRAARKV